MTDQPIECGDACAEHHTYGPDCAALDPNWDPTIGLRYWYAAALYQAGEDRAFAPYLDREQCGELADAVVAARDVELTNSRRIWKQQHAELIEAYQASQRRTIRIQTLLDEQRDRIRKIHRRYADGTCWADGEPYPCPTITALEPTA